MKHLNVTLHYLKLQDDTVLERFNPIPYAIITSVRQPGDASCLSQKADQSFASSSHRIPLAHVRACCDDTADSSELAGILSTIAAQNIENSDPC